MQTQSTFQQFIISLEQEISSSHVHNINKTLPWGKSETKANQKIEPKCENFNYLWFIWQVFWVIGNLSRM